MDAKPFRFAVTAPVLGGSLPDWQDKVRHIEALGFDTVVVADHFTQGYAIEPMVALTAAALSTSTLRLQTGVLGNDYRHPVLTHRMAAALDEVSGGRFTLGLGAGWMVSDYRAAGLAYDSPGVRVSRLEEAVAVIKGLFGPEPFSYDGTYYTIRSLDGLPKPHGMHRPPLFLGGGSPRVLRFAGREADQVGINAALTKGELGRHAVVDLSSERVTEKIGWVRQGATEAGRDVADIELEINQWLVRITATEDEATAFLDKIAGRFDVTPDALEDSPSVLVGTVDHCIDQLLRRREQFGFSSIQLDAGFPPADLEALAPIVSALSDR